MSDSHQSDPTVAHAFAGVRDGLLENDIIFERFFSRYEHDLTDADVGALSRLLDLSDNDLMDLLLARKEPEGDLRQPGYSPAVGDAAQRVTPRCNALCPLSNPVSLFRLRMCHDSV